jgi:penicillin-binding protein 2
MPHFKHANPPQSTFRPRVLIASLFALVGFGLLGWRMVHLQVVHGNRYALQAEGNRIAVAPIVPARGTISDRRGVVLAQNQFEYTLEITPSQLDDTIDRVIDELSTIIPISDADRSRFKKRRAESKRFEGVPIRTRLTDDEVARFTAQRFRFRGVDVNVQALRHYPLGTTAAHVVGYVGRVSAHDQARIAALSEKNNSDPDRYDPRIDAKNYKGTNDIGKIGIEQRYETELHGLTGFEEVEVTAGGRPVRSLLRMEATPGNNLVLSLDVGLQQLAEQAFAGRRGALVAIEPSTGDVLAFVSAPSFDPNAFVGGIDQLKWDALNNSPDYPLLNRPLHGIYPPGSTYKPFIALAALALGVRTPQWTFFDPGYYKLGNQTFRNDVPTGHGRVDMNRAITVSNNTYFYMLAHEMGVDAIAGFVKPWGFGQLTGIDIAGESRGVLPSTEWKKQAFPLHPLWYEGDTVSLGNGQGYNAFTIVQLAHAVATLANDGVAMTPRFVRAIENPTSDHSQALVPTERSRIDVRQQDLDVVKRAMQNVNMSPSGTAYRVFKDAPFTSAGKTGTSQVFSLRGSKYRRDAVAERLRDHALYVAFAPVDKPRIAIAVIIENGGWGRVAAPIARDLMTYWLGDDPDA